MKAIASGIKNRNTTVLGVLAIIAGLAEPLKALFDGDATTSPDWGIAVTAVFVGIGLIFAKDASVGSQP